MKIEFRQSFIDSLNRIEWQQNSKLYKVYKFLRYDIKWFFKNIWDFKSELLQFRPWEWRSNLEILKKSLELTKYTLENYSDEEKATLLPKIEKLNETLHVLDVIINNDFIYLAQRDLGTFFVKAPVSEQNNGFLFFDDDALTDAQKENNDKIIKVSKELEGRYWDQLWLLLKENLQTWWD